MVIPWLLSVTLLLLPHCEGHGSCREAKLCCKGRDPSCAVHISESFSLNNIVSDSDKGFERPCYCDHACLKVGDCCSDYQHVCGAIDCEVSEWGPWSGCTAAECGITGVMTRDRRIVRAPTNGGELCPDLLQKRSCYSGQCDTKASHLKANRETAMILPAVYSNTRHVNATNDIRRNLRLRYRKDPAEESSKEYCIIFEVTKAKKTCENLGEEISPKLSKGSRTCVRCETAAMRKHLGYRCQGHGVEHKTTRFTFLASPQCHGRWQRKEISENCACHSDGKADFIFV